MPSSCPNQLNSQFKMMMNLTAKTGDEYFTIFKNGTFHTHPNGVPLLSDVDEKTTKRLGLPLACIGLVPQRKTQCFNVPKEGNEFTKACRF